jgi:NADH-quinone oxidoreductase subunit E
MTTLDGDLTQAIEEALDSSHGNHTVALLQAVQHQLGYLPLQALEAIADRLDQSPATVYGVATFYNQFRFSPPGRHHVRVCEGTACHINGGRAVHDEWRRKLGIEDGDVTDDGAFSLEAVACVGCCTLAPVTLVGEEVHGQLSPASVDDLMLRYRLHDERSDNSATDGQKPSGESES